MHNRTLSKRPNSRLILFLIFSPSVNFPRRTSYYHRERRESIEGGSHFLPSILAGRWGVPRTNPRTGGGASRTHARAATRLGELSDSPAVRQCGRAWLCVRMVDRARCLGHCWARSELCTCCPSPAFALASDHLHHRVVPSLVVNLNQRGLKMSPVKAELQEGDPSQPTSEYGRK